tara:strand:+ start:3401 stop:3808 length:408 start_codon:yes stop_codon:yes gene_type:complete
MKIEKKYYFYAGHRNKTAGEKCSRLHGHTYDVKCIFKFDTMKNGVTMLFSDIDKKVEPIIKYYDHYFILWEEDSLCDILKFANEPYREVPFETSAENMAIWIFNRIKNEAEMPITRIELKETKTSTIIYEPEISN